VFYTYFYIPSTLLKLLSYVNYHSMIMLSCFQSYFRIFALQFPNTDIEIIGIQLELNNLAMCIIAVYKPPTTPLRQFLDSLQRSLQQLQEPMISTMPITHSHSTNFFKWIDSNSILKLQHTNLEEFWILSSAHLPTWMSQHGLYLTQIIISSQCYYQHKAK